MRPDDRYKLRFAQFELDLRWGCLLDKGEIELRPKAFEALSYFGTNAGRLVRNEPGHAGARHRGHTLSIPHATVSRRDYLRRFASLLRGVANLDLYHLEVDITDILYLNGAT